MAIISNHDQQHITRMFLQEQRVNAIYNEFIRVASEYLKRYRDTASKNVWVRNSDIETAIDRKLIELKSVLEKEINAGTLKSWNLSNDKNDKLVERFIDNLAVSKIMREGMFNRNFNAYDAFLNRQINGLDLSGRVWKTVEQTKENIELFLSSGIATGRSAEQIGRDLRQLLQQPDKRFHRIRNEKGELIPSAPMKDYNPGTGVYRSARMNAIRLAGTEVNMAYRTADHTRWQQLDFILGYEVHRSQNHKPCAVCDALKGKYPKSFIFPGWHPFCICYAVPLQMNHDEFADYLINETVPEKLIIKDIPASAAEFFENNPKYKESSYAGKANKGWFAANNIPYIINDYVMSDRSYIDGKEVEEIIKRNVDIEEIEGVKILIPTDLDNNKQFIKKDDLIVEVKELPKFLKKGIEEIRLVDYASTYDDYYRKKYNMPNLKSFASDGSKITFYDNQSEIKKSDLKKTLLHEAGHYLDIKMGRVSTKEEYIKCMYEDQKYLKLRHKYVSSYAKESKSTEEDFADSIVEYVSIGYEKFKVFYPNRAEFIRNFELAFE